MSVAALVCEEAEEKRRIGLAASLASRAAMARCRCGRGIRVLGAATCAACHKTSTAKLQQPVIPTILDDIPGTGRCLGGVDTAKACGISWGNLDHRHCPCGEPIAAYWQPEVDCIYGGDEDEEHRKRQRRTRGANGRLIPLAPVHNLQLAEGCCGKCELRNLPLSLRVYSERARTEGHLPAPRTTGRARISPPRLATDLVSTPRGGGLI